MDTNIQVAIRVRPIIERERKAGQKSLWKTDDNKIYDQKNAFVFDRVFGQNVNTLSIYDDIAKPIIEKAMEGFNGTIFAYGQTASGKTHTIMGDDDELGILPLAIKDVFNFTEIKPDREFLLRVSYIEIYNEEITDLIHNQGSIKVRNNIENEIIIENLTEVNVVSDEEAIGIVRRGLRNRKIGTTNMNERSSRSHVIFRLVIESRQVSDDISDISSNFDGAVTVSQLNLVDLAGSERVGQTGAQGMRLKESTFINQSLLTLGNVIRKLSESEEVHIPYRDSKLTRILQNSLGGNASTSIICAVSPVVQDETEQTLKFAGRAKCVKNRLKKNEIVDGDTMLRRQMKEISDLRKKLKEFESGSVHTDLLIEKDKMQQNFQQRIGHLEERISKLNEQVVCVGRTQPRQVLLKSSKDRRLTWCPGQGPSSFQPIQIKMEEPKSCITVRPRRKIAAPELVTKKLRIEPVSEANETEFMTTTDETDNSNMTFEKLEYSLLKEEYEEFKVTSSKELSSLKEEYEKQIKELSDEVQTYKNVEKNIDKDSNMLETNKEQEIIELKEALSAWQKKCETLEESSKDMISAEYLQVLQAEVEKKGKELEDANELTKHENELLKNELDALKERWQNQVKNLDNEKVALENLVNDLRSEKSETITKNNMDELETELTMYKDSLSLKDDYIKTLQEQIKSLTTQSENREIQLEQLRKESSSFNDQLKQHENSLADALTTITEKEEKITHLLAEINDQSAALDLEKQTSEYNEKLLESLKEELETYKTDRDILQEKANKQNDADNETELYINQMKELEDKIVEMQKEQEIIVNEKQNFEANYNAQSIEIEALRNNLEVANNSKEVLENANNERISELQQQIVQIKEENELYEKQVKDMVDLESKSLETLVELSSMTRKLKGSEELHDGLQLKYEALQIYHEKMSHDVTNHKDEIEKISQEKSEIENELKILKEKYNILYSESSKNEEKISSNNIELSLKINFLEEQAKENEQLRNESKQIKYHNNDLLNKIKLLEEKISSETENKEGRQNEDFIKISEAKQKLQEELFSLNNNLNTMAMEWNQKESNMTEANKELSHEIDVLKEQIQKDNVNLENEEMRKQNIELERKVEQLVQQISLLSGDSEHQVDMLQLAEQKQTAENQLREMNEQLVSMLSEWNEKETSLNNINAELHQKIETLTESKNNAENEIKELNIKFETTVSEWNEKEASISNVNAELTHQIELLRQQKLEEYNSLKTAYEMKGEINLKKEVEEIQSKTINDSYSENEQGTNSLKSEIMNLEKQLRDADTNLQLSINNKDAEISALTEQLNTERQQCIISATNLESLKERYGNLETERSQIERDLYIRIDNLELGVTSFREKNQENEELIKTLSEKINAQSESNDLMQQQEKIDEPEHSHHLLEDKFVEQSKVMEKLQEENERLSELLEPIEAEKIRLEEKVLELETNLQNEIDSHFSQKAEDKQMLESHADEILALKEKLQVVDRKEEEYNRIKESLESDIETLKDCMESQQHEVDTLQADNEKKINEVKQLSEQLTRLKELEINFEENKNTIKQLTEELTKLKEIESENEKFKNELNEKTFELENSSARVLELNNEINNLNENCNSLKSEYDSKYEEAERLSNELSVLSEKLLYLDSMNDVVSYKDTELKTTNDKLNELENKVKDLEEEKSLMCEKISKLDEELSEHKSIIEELQTKNKIIEEQFEQEQDRYLDLQHSAVSVESDRNELQLRVNELNTDLKNLQEEIDSLKTNKKDSDRDILQKENEIIDLKESIDIKQRELLESNSKLKSCYETIEGFENTIKGSDDEKIKYGELKVKYDQMKCDYEGRLNELQTALIDTKRQAEEWKVLLEKNQQRANIQIASMESSNNELGMCLKNLQRDYNNALLEKNKLIEEFKSQSEKMKSLKEMEQANAERINTMQSQMLVHENWSNQLEVMKQKNIEINQLYENICEENKSLKIKNEEYSAKVSLVEKKDITISNLEKELENVRLELSKKNLSLEQDSKLESSELIAKYNKLLLEYDSLKEKHEGMINKTNVVKDGNEHSETIGNLTRKNAILLREKNMYKEHIREQDTTIDKLKKEKSNAIDQTKRMSDEMKRLWRPSENANIKEWEDRVGELEKENFKQRREQEKLQDQIEILQRKLEKSFVDVNNAEVYSKKYKKEIERMKSQLNGIGGPLQDQIDDLKKELEKTNEEKNSFEGYVEKAYAKWKAEQKAREELSKNFQETCQSKDEAYAKVDEALRLAFGRYKHYKELFQAKCTELSTVKTNYNESLRKQEILTKKLISLDGSKHLLSTEEETPSIQATVKRRPLQTMTNISDNLTTTDGGLGNLTASDPLFLPSNSNQDESQDLEALFATKKRKSDEQISGSSRKMKYQP